MIKIKRTVWLHGRNFKPGQESILEKMGLPEETRRQLIQRGSIVEQSPINATGDAQALADEHKIDIAAMEGSGRGGRIYKKDVQAIIDEIEPNDGRDREG